MHQPYFSINEYNNIMLWLTPWLHRDYTWYRFFRTLSILLLFFGTLDFTTAIIGLSPLLFGIGVDLKLANVQASLYKSTTNGLGKPAKCTIGCWQNSRSPTVALWYVIIGQRKLSVIRSPLVAKRAIILRNVEQESFGLRRLTDIKSRIMAM